MMFRILAFFIILAGTHSFAQAQDFMGLKLGMSSTEVLKKLEKKIDLNGVPVISGKKIVNDTILFPSCEQPFRRSIGFSTDHKLSAIGLTHRTDSIQSALITACVLNYLKHEYGVPDIEVRDGITIYSWKFDEAIVTLDSKAYNERDWFVLIYYYEQKSLTKIEE